MKTPFLALIATLTVGFLPVSQAENEVSAPVASTKPIFGTSAEECSKRINQIMNLYPSFVVYADIRKDTLDEEVLELKLSDWNESALDAFYPALFNCQNWQSISDWSALVKTKLPIYIAEKQKNALLADRLNKADTSAGVSLSCMDGLDYPLPSRGRYTQTNDTTDYSVYQPMNIQFRKDFAQYTDADYSFVRQKLAACASVIDDFTTSTGNPVADSTKLRKLSTDIAGWGSFQTKLIGEQNVATAAAEASQLKKTEEDRRKNNPTFIERVAGYLKGVGTIGFLLSLAMVPRKDARFKTGVKNNAKIPGWVWITFAVSIGMILLGGVIG